MTELNPMPILRQNSTGGTEHVLTLPTREGKNLYVVRFRPDRTVEAKGSDDLTPEDTAKGAMTFENWDGKWCRSFPGHAFGSLREVRAQAVLTWNVKSGDEILHVFDVRFSGEKQLVWSQGCVRTGLPNWQQAKCDPIVNYVRVYCDSTPGRSASLGEDTLDAAFGKDAIEDQIEHALADDWRNCLCSLRYESAPSDDKEWEEWRKKNRIEVKA